MDKEQRAALRKVAEEATPGPWICEQETVHTGQVCSVNQGGLPWFEVWSENWSQDSNNQADADHIAAANPQAILQLLDYIETLEKEAGRYRWFSKYLVSDRTDLDDAIVACDSTVSLNIVIDAAMGETE